MKILRFSINSHKGFTLIEIMVSIALFSIIVTAFIGLFGSAFLEQEKSLNMAYLLNNGSYIMEYISRSLRMAQKELGSPLICLSEYGLNYQTEWSGNKIVFLNYQGECQEFYLEDKIIKVKKGETIESLTPLNIEIENLNFEVIGASQSDLIQPKVTFTLELKTKKKPVRSLKLQTTVSQRLMDVSY